MLESDGGRESDPVALAGMARGRLRAKRSQLEQALTGRVSAHHRFLLESHLQHIDFLGKQIERTVRKSRRAWSRTIWPATGHSTGRRDGSWADKVPHQPEASEGRENTLSAVQAVALLDYYPGIDRWQAEVILAEIGLDMGRFPTAAHLASWAEWRRATTRARGNGVRARHDPATPP